MWSTPEEQPCYSAVWVVLLCNQHLQNINVTLRVIPEEVK